MAIGTDPFPERWEYRVLTHSCNPYASAKDRIDEKQRIDELNSLGSEGWELVAAVPMISEDATNEITFVFKRRREF
jgi:Domain of unknown function (DUF4177)